MDPKLSTRQFAILGLTFAYQLVSVVGTAVSIGRDLPPEWMGLLSSGGEVWVDFLVGGGTALSPPLVSLLAIAVAAVVSLRADRAGRIATAVLAALVALNVIGALGEPVTWRSLSPGTFEPLNASISVLMVVIPAVLAIVAYQEFRARRSAG